MGRRPIRVPEGSLYATGESSPLERNDLHQWAKRDEVVTGVTRAKAEPESTRSTEWERCPLYKIHEIDLATGITIKESDVTTFFD